MDPVVIVTDVRTPLRVETVLGQSAWLRRLTRGLVAGDDRAKDVLQETLLVAVENEGEMVGSVRSWLSRVARNVANRLHGQERVRRLAETARERPGFAPSTVDVVGETEMQQRVTTATLALAEPYRTTILLRYQREMSYADIAERMGVPIETVRTRIKRGLNRLRRDLDHAHGGTRAWAVPILGVFGYEKLVTTVGVGGSGSVVLGSLMLGGMMVKLASSLAAILVLCCLWMLWPWSQDVRIDTASEGLPPAAATGDAGPVTGADGDTAGERSPLAAIADRVPTGTGSLVVRVVHALDRASIANVGILVREHANPDPLFGVRRLRTDASGVARVDGLEPGRISISTDRVRMVPESAREAVVEAGKEVEIEIELPIGLRVRGIVVDPSGAPVSGASVHGYLDAIRALPGAAAVTGPDGRFTLVAVEPGSELHAIASGFDSSPSYRVSGNAGATVELRITFVAAGGAVEGRVLGPDGSKIAGAVVCVRSPQLGRTVRLPDGRSQPRSQPHHWVTAGDGSFRSDAVEPGEHYVWVRAPRLAQWRGKCVIVKHQTTQLVVRMSPDVVCEGTVTYADGKPAVEIGVSVNGWGGSMTDYHAETDARGHYRLSGLPARAIQVVAVSGAHRAAARVEGVPGEVNRCDLQFGAGSVLHGRVLTERGEAVQNADIGVTGAGAGGLHTTTDARGRFVVRDCPVGVTVDVSSNNFTLARKLNVDPRLGELEIRVKGKADVHIKGRVVDASGQPVGKAIVISLPRHAARFPSHNSDARTGQFDVGPIPPGWYRLLVMSSGFAWYRSTDRKLTAGETWDVGAVRLHRGGRLAVRIGSAAVSSQAKSKIRMAVIDSGFRSLVRLRIGADLVRSKLLAPGRYLLSVTGPDVAAQAIPFVITDGEDRELDVTLTVGRQCKFSVQVPPSVGEHEMVRLTIEGAGGVVQDRMVPRRKAPTFVFECGLATGRYTVTVRAESGPRSKTNITVSGKKKLQFELSLR